MPCADRIELFLLFNWVECCMHPQASDPTLKRALPPTLRHVPAGQARHPSRPLGNEPCWHLVMSPDKSMMRPKKKKAKPKKSCGFLASSDRKIKRLWPIWNGCGDRQALGSFAACFSRKNTLGIRAEQGGCYPWGSEFVISYFV